MLTCPQFEGMNVYEHGISVANRYDDLTSHIADPHYSCLRYKWRLADWIFEEKIFSKRLDIDTVELYQIYHDCGKPYCLTIDDVGQQHFPDHAAISKRIWDEHSSGSEEDKIVGELIGMDMLAHTIKGEQIDEFVKHPYAATLLYTALAEVHSNAQHLGRLDSDGFKMKCKQLEKVAKRLLKSMT